MSHFRVENARFRILKGGKIGLSLSIALASSLILYPVDGNSAEKKYFEDVKVTLQDPKHTTTGISSDGNTTYSLTVEQATNQGSISVTRGNDEDADDDIIINPTSWATSSYSTPTFSQAPQNSTLPDRFNVQKTNDENLTLKLTFDDGANANKIEKKETNFYSADNIPNGYVVAKDQSEGDALGLSTTSSSNYTSNLVMKGNNTVSGSVDIGNGTVFISGENVSFKDELKSSKIEFTLDGEVKLNKGFDGNIVTTGNSQGTLVLEGSSNQTIKGIVGTNSNSLKEIQSGVNNTTSTFEKEVYSNKITSTGDGTTVFKEKLTTDNLDIGSGIIDINKNSNIKNTTIGNGKLNLNDGADIIGGSNSEIKFTSSSGEINLSDNSNIDVSKIVSEYDGQGIINIYGESNIKGTLGEDGKKLNTINAENNSKATIENSTYVLNTNIKDNAELTFKNNLDSTNTTIGSGKLNLNNGADLKGTTVDFTNTNAELNLSDGSDITVTNITSTNGNNGKINIAGNSTISGNIGTGNKISEININGSNNQNVILNNSVNVDNLNVKNGNLTLKDTTTASNTTIDNGKINIENIFNGNITGSNPTQGEVNFNSTGNQNYSGEITNLKDVNVNSNLTVSGGKIESANTNIKNDNTLTLNNSTVTSNIKTENNELGNLKLDGVNKINGNIGEVGSKLNSIEALDNSTTTIDGKVFVKDLNVNSGNITLKDETTADKTIINAGKLNIEKNFNGNISGTSTTQGEVNFNATGNQNYSGEISNLKDVNVNSSLTVNGKIESANTNIKNNHTLTLDNSIVNSSIKTDTNGSGNLKLTGNNSITGDIGETNKKLNTVEALNGSNTTINDNIYANDIKLNSNSTITSSGNITANIDGSANNTGTLNMSGASQIINGNIGNINSIKDFNINSGITTLNGNLNAQNTTILQNATLDSKGDLKGIIQGDGKLELSGEKVQKVTGSIEVTKTEVKTNTTLQLQNNSTIDSLLSGAGTLDIVGNSTIKKEVGSSIDKFGEIKTTTSSSNAIFKENVFANNVNLNSGTMTFEKDLNATTTTITNGTGNFNSLQTNLNFDGNGTAYLNQGIIGNINFAGNNANNATVILNAGNISGSISANGTNGKLNIAGTSTIYGTVGTDTLNRLNEINSTSINTDATFKENVFANKVNVNSGTMTFEKDLNSTTTTITNGTGNFNSLQSNLNFDGNGTAYLNQGIIGDINFAGNNAVVNIKDEKIIDGNIATTINNTGIINFDGDSEVTGTIGNVGLGIKELNVNTNGEERDNDGNILPNDGLFLHRDVYADRIKLQNNATLVLKDGANLIDTGIDKVLLTTDANGTGKVVFQGASNVKGQIGTSEKGLQSLIISGDDTKKVTLEDKVYVNEIKFTQNGHLELGDELLGKIDFDSKFAKLSIKDNTNLNTSNTTFENANNATLRFEGNSIVAGVVGGNSVGKSTFDTIEAGNNAKRVEFQDEVYTNNFIVDNGVVDFKNDLNAQKIVFTDNGTINIEDKRYLKGEILNNSTFSQGILNFKGDLNVDHDVGTKNNILKAVNIASDTTRDVIQDLKYNIYAENTTIGNNNNSVELNFKKDDITFGGNLNLNKNTKLNIDDKKVIVNNKLDLKDDVVLSYKVTDSKTGIIEAKNLDLKDSVKFEIDYDYSSNKYLKDSYNLIVTNNDIKVNGSINPYFKLTENDGVKDNSIIDSTIEIDGYNLVLKADRTSGGSHKAEDLYIAKSEIGNDYSNGASQSLAGYANGSKREDALADIIRDLEYLEGGITITDEKKAQMIDIQRKLAPKANSATVQSAMNVSKVSNEMVSSRIADIRRDIFEDRLAYAVDNSPTFTGYNSGDDYYYDVGDSTLWIKASYTKATQDAVKSYDGYKTKSYGATAGIDKVVGDDVIFGISASYFDTKVSQNRGDDDTKSYRGTIYGSSEFGLAYVDANVSFAHHETDSSREANSGKLSSKIKAQELSARVETGLNLPIDDGSYITPYVAVEHSIYKQKAYQEKGSKYQNDALKVDAVNLNTTSAEIGAKLTGRIELENALIIPHLRASVTNNFNHKNKDVKAQFVGGGSKFSTPHQDLHKTIYSVGTGIEARITNNSSIILDATYDRSKDGKYRAYGANISFGYSF